MQPLIDLEPIIRQYGPIVSMGYVLLFVYMFTRMMFKLSKPRDFSPSYVLRNPSGWRRMETASKKANYY